MEPFLLLSQGVVLYFGFALLALSQERHWRAAGAPLPRSSMAIGGWRVIGYALIGCGLPLAIWQEGAGFGSLLWGTLSSIAAMAVTATLSWRPHWLKVFTRVAAR